VGYKLDFLNNLWPDRNLFVCRCAFGKRGANDSRCASSGGGRRKKIACKQPDFEED